MTGIITYSTLNSPEDFERATDVEIAVWGLGLRDAIPSSLFRAVTLNGGVLIGAYDGDNLIGIAFAFSTQRGTRRVLWSHLTGVLPAFQGQGVGEKLKWVQREWAIEHDFDEIRWTFDPLQRGNANFNLARLGTFADRYHVNLYGTMTDQINGGMPSDRVEAAWDLHNGTLHYDSPSDNTPFALRIARNQTPEICIVDSSAEQYWVEIPPSLAALRDQDRQLALEWRLALRSALLSAFDQNFAIVNFLSVPKQHAQAYLIAKLRN